LISTGHRQWGFTVNGHRQMLDEFSLPVWRQDVA
jgi:hypothetical protein